MPITLILVIQIICALVFAAIEPAMDFSTAFYHCLITATTVGYGDIDITSDGSRVFAIVHILISVSLLAAVISDVSELQQDLSLAIKRYNMFQSRLDPSLMASLDTDGNGVDKFEFVTGMLVQLQILDQARGSRGGGRERGPGWGGRGGLPWVGGREGRARGAACDSLPPPAATCHRPPPPATACHGLPWPPARASASLLHWALPRGAESDAVVCHAARWCAALMCCADVLRWHLRWRGAGAVGRGEFQQAV